MIEFGIGDLIVYQAQVGEWRSVEVAIYVRRIANGRVVDGNVSCRLEEVTRVLTPNERLPKELQTKGGKT